MLLKNNPKLLLQPNHLILQMVALSQQEAAKRALSLLTR
jgi:hypothetical protein